MTISSQTRKAGPFNGNDVTTSFPFTFKTFAKEDLQVVFTDTDSIESTLVLDSDYTVSLNEDQNANPGGTVSYSTLATGEKLTIVGSVEYTQETDIQNQGGFYPEVFENALDKTTMLIQQVKEIADRSVQVPVSSDILPEDYLTTVEVYKTEAAASASAASASETAAGLSEAAALLAKTNAETAEVNAELAETNAEAAQAAAAISASAAATSATAAQTAETNAETAQALTEAARDAALIAETNAELAETNAELAETNAEASALAAATSFSDFDIRYLGSKASDPTLNNVGGALADGALYFNTTDNVMKVYDLGTTTWLTAFVPTSGYLLAINNLNDLTNVGTARDNLGLSTASQAEMEAGTEVLLRAMSPLRVKQAITANAPTAFPSGTRMTFNQTSAPTGWTKDTTAGLDDSIMRIVTGSVSSGGSNAFSTFNGQTSVGATTLSTAEMPSHTHVEQLNASGSTASYMISSGGALIGVTLTGTTYDTSSSSPVSTQATGGGGSHTHTMTTSIKYNDFIIASKD
jgi:chemotaxis protein histidine kinase CheA